MIRIAAIAVGCIAAFVVLKYVSGIEDKANEDAQRVPVLVVRADIPQGTPGETAVEQGLIVEDEIAQEFLPATRITDLDQITGKVALNNLAANQVLVDGMFVDPATSNIGFGQRLEENHVAYSLPITGDSTVGGLLVPGDLVNIFYLAAGAGDEDEGEVVTDEESFGSDARLLYHQVRILAIGTQTAPTAGEQASADAEAAPADPAAPVTASGVLTLDLPLDAAQLLASVDPGSLQLALTGPDYRATPLPRIDPADLDALPGETNADTRFGTLTPYGPDGPQ
jgi:pilus assembly protein CpaB